MEVPAVLFHVVQYIQSPAAPVPFQHVRRVCNFLQFFQYKYRHINRTFQKAGAINIRHPAVDNHIGIQKLSVFFILILFPFRF